MPALRDPWELCRILKAARIDQGIAQWEVADALGVLQATVSMWESCRCMPSLDTAMMWAALLGHHVAVQPFTGTDTIVAERIAGFH